MTQMMSGAKQLNDHLVLWIYYCKNQTLFRMEIISFAPGEGNRPLGIFMDKDSEFLSFPTIYCGKRQADNSERSVPVHYSTLCKWELRSRDRRVAQSVPNIFYKLKKLQIRQIQGSASLSLHRCKTKGKRYTAGEVGKFCQ